MERDGDQVLQVVADRTLASLESSLQVLELIGYSGLNPSQRGRLRAIEERANDLNMEPSFSPGATSDSGGFSGAGGGGPTPPSPRMPLPSLGPAPSRPVVPPLGRSISKPKGSARSDGSASSGRSRSRSSRGRPEPDPLPIDAPSIASIRPAAPTAAVVSLEELERLDVPPVVRPTPTPPDIDSSKGRLKKVSLRW